MILNQWKDNIVSSTALLCQLVCSFMMYDLFDDFIIYVLTSAKIEPDIFSFFEGIFPSIIEKSVAEY